VKKNVPLRCRGCVKRHQHCSFKDASWNVSEWPKIEQNWKGAERRASNAAAKKLSGVMSTSQPLKAPRMTLRDVSRFDLLLEDDTRTSTSVRNAIEDLRAGIERDERNLQAATEVISQRRQQMESWIQEFEEDAEELETAEEVEEQIMEGTESPDESKNKDEESDGVEYEEWHGFGKDKDGNPVEVAEGEGSDSVGEEDSESESEDEDEGSEGKESESDEEEEEDDEIVEDSEERGTSLEA